MSTEIIDFSPEYYDAAMELWKRCEGIGLSDADEKAPMTAFLLKNPGLNFIALDR